MSQRYILGLFFILLFCSSVPVVASQSIGSEIVLLTAIVDNQIREIKKLDKELEMLVNTYKRFDNGIIKDLLQKDLESLKEVIYEEITYFLALDGFVKEHIEIIQRDDLPIKQKQKLLDDMKSIVYDIHEQELSTDISKPLVRQYDNYKEILEKIESQDSLLEQVQLLNINMLENNKQLSQLLYEIRNMQKYQSMDITLQETEEKIIKEKANTFWGLNK